LLKSRSGCLSTSSKIRVPRCSTSLWSDLIGEG
jgi:hypothetical protein